MNEFLAELYGTSDIIASDPSPEETEKLAAADFLVKLAAEENVDLDSLTDEQVGELLAEVEKTAAEDTGVEDESQEKLAEADFLGRAMAHAYVNELGEIEKNAGARTEAATAAGKKLLGKVREYASRAGEATGVSQMGRGLKAKGKSVLREREMAREMAGKSPAKWGQASMKGRSGTPKSWHKGEEELAPGAKRFAKRVLAPAAALTTAGGIGYGVKRSFDEQFEDAAQERAYAMLADAGYDVEKTAETDVEAAVNERALDMLQEAGYEVE